MYFWVRSERSLNLFDFLARHEPKNISRVTHIMAGTRIESGDDHQSFHGDSLGALKAEGETWSDSLSCLADNTVSLVFRDRPEAFETGGSIIQLSMSKGALGVIVKYFRQSEPSGNS
jgi:hypothetical protein